MMYPSRYSSMLRMGLLCTVVLAAACTSPAKDAGNPAPPPPQIVFPPHEAMQSGAYSVLLGENQKAMLECSKEPQCAVALFNLGFVYCYPHSPYYNLAKGLYYFDALIKSYPKNPLASEAKAWKELIKRNLVVENTQKRLKGELKSKDAALKELQKQVTQPKEASGNGNLEESPAVRSETPVSKEMETENERMERDIHKKLEASQAIDAEIDQKERKLLQR